jgi:hypothetical protein
MFLESPDIQKERYMMKRILLAVLLLATACAAPAPTTDETLAAPVGTSTAMPVETATTAPVPTATILPVEAPMQPAFARYDLQPVNVSPSLRQEPVDPSFDNVLVPLVLSPEQLQRLVADGVIASPREHPEFHDLYRETQFANLPVFVTSDGLLHAYHLMFDATLLQLEEQVFLPHLQEFNRALLEQAEAQYQALQGTAWEDSARRVAAFIAVGGKLADPDFPVPDYAADLVEAELALINAAGGPQPSPIFPLLAFGEDYSQYLPRGHYAKTDSLKAYFKSMMWYGRMTFRLADPDETAWRSC